MNPIKRLDNSMLMGNTIYVKKGTRFTETFIHWHSYYELVFYSNADVLCRINETSINFTSNSLYLLTPFDFHTTKNKKENGNAYFINISFSADALDSDIISKITQGYYIENIKKDSEITLLINMLQSTSESNKKHLLSALINCIVETGTPLPVHSKTSADTIVKKAVDYITQKYSEKITLNDVSAHLHLAPSYFSDVFSKRMGCTFTEYLTKFRLDYSKQLLSKTDKTVTEICYDSGFSSLSRYLRVFKEHFNLTPTQYRNKKK